MILNFFQRRYQKGSFLVIGILTLFSILNCFLNCSRTIVIFNKRSFFPGGSINRLHGDLGIIIKIQFCFFVEIRGLNLWYLGCAKSLRFLQIYFGEFIQRAFPQRRHCLIFRIWFFDFRDHIWSIWVCRNLGFLFGGSLNQLVYSTLYRDNATCWRHEWFLFLF